MLSDDELRNACVLVYANKQDFPNAISPGELAEQLNLKNINRPYKVQACCATTGDGLYEGLDWLTLNVTKK